MTELKIMDREDTRILNEPNQAKISQALFESYKDFTPSASLSQAEKSYAKEVRRF